MKKRLIYMLSGLLFATTVSAQQGDPFSAESTDFEVWGPRLVQDNLMPGANDIAYFRYRIDALFSGKEESTVPVTSLKVLRQDHVTLQYNRSCMNTPLKIGSKDFNKGLGSHANSELQVRFPEPVVRFSAMVGIDNNYSTGGTRGSVQFVIRTGDKELLRTPVLRGSDEALAVDLALPPNTSTLNLLIESTDDGEGWDQSDWCEPLAIGVSGKKYDLTERELTHPDNLPFSFDYDGRSSREFLSSWKFERKETDALNTVYSWTDPASGMRMEAQVRLFAQYAAADWILYFTNTGKRNSGLITNVKTLDARFDGVFNSSPVIHTLIGDDCSANAWMPAKYEIRKDETRHFAPVGGRPSNGVSPFWNIQQGGAVDAQTSEGLFVMLGWTGQWAADFKLSPSGLSVSAGMEKIATVLYPGESIRQPRTLIMPWRSDRTSAQVLFRRLLMFEYTPKMPNHLPPQLPVCLQGFDRYFYGKLPGYESLKGQLESVKIEYEMGTDTHWFDAGWFEPENDYKWYNYVGNWTPDKKVYPQGLGPLGKAIHERGMKFMLWFEPERVVPNTMITNKHPEYVFGNEKGGLFKLNDPKARKFLTDLLDDRFKSYGVDVFRNDFNIDPLKYWRANDTIDNRQGMTEIRYVEGHYEMWNSLRASNPGLWIDNCASGGRRIDLETTAISVPIWRSDTYCSPGHVEWGQTQTLGIMQYLPLSSAASWESDPYDFRSSANPGGLGSFGYFDKDFDAEQAKSAFIEAKVYQKFWYGDFYPLTEASLGTNNLLSWQLHREDLQAGIIYVFRQDHCPYIGTELSPHAIDPNAQYQIRIKRDYSTPPAQIITGIELMQLVVDLPQKRSSVVVEYLKLKS
ncbi:MAG: alpha-galactosidase [Dysgonamonadaceae bacterium]|jgi:alpha-galactosidase|nr:alpha-galactosidase [Dysgonamonadaceae bacterium]